MRNAIQNSFAEDDFVEVPAEYFDDDEDVAAGENAVVSEGAWVFFYNFHFLVIYETCGGCSSLTVLF
jgi:hypothetical protein